jgi:shikimate kinase
VNLILFGFKGTGKSYFGKRLAETQGLTFFDSDRLIEAKAALSCREIVISRGEKLFRQLEEEVVESLQNVQHAVIALGGGALISEKNRKAIENMGVLLYLKASKEFLKKRILSEELPAFLDPQDPEGSFDKIYHQRTEIYEKISAFPVDVDGKTDDEILWEATPLAYSLK